MTDREERFFGVQTQIGTRAGDLPQKDDDQGELVIEIVDDIPKKPETPEEDHDEEGKKKDVGFKGPYDPSHDEELASYSARVQARIKDLAFQAHEAKRQREAAEKMREEAVRVAQQLSEQAKQYQSVLQQGETALLTQTKERAQLALATAKAAYRQAYEEGNADKILEAQDALSKAHNELHDLDYRERQLQARQPQQEQQPPPPPQHQAPPQQQARPELSDRQKRWAQDNPWFGNPDHPDMTALAYGVHERLVRREGVAPNSDDYYQRIDAEMRKKFPEYFATGNGDDGHSTAAPVPKQPNTVVAPGGRNNGAKPRTVQLTATQAALAKRLGLTPEQYAMQLLKEKLNG